MSQLEETDDFYAAGRKISEHIADSKGKEVSTATLQALIRDFLPQHEELQEALRSIVARPDFLQLVKLAGCEKGILQRDAFLERLKDTYSPKVISATEYFINGLLKICTGNGIRTASKKQDKASSPGKINENETSVTNAKQTQERLKWSGFTGFD
jgi:hypothetical protein